MEDNRASFLLQEHRYFSESFWRNEEVGEKRFNYFVTLVTAVIAALVALHTAEGVDLSPLSARTITVGSLVSLLLVGAATLLRMIQRNRVTDGYKRALDHIREICRSNNYDQVERYDPFVDGPHIGEPRKLGTGGLAETVSVVNSIIFAVIVAVLSEASYSSIGIWYVLSAFALSLGGQLLFLRFSK